MDSGLQKTVTKRPRFSEDVSRCNNQDMISNLPDALISHILSFLPTKYAVGTTILSKRWNYLWTSVKNLDFNSSLILNIGRGYYASSDEFMKSFVEFVERVLFFHDGMSVDKLCISSRSRVCDNQIYTWVSAVLPCHLKELQVTSTSVRQTPSSELWQVDLPWSLFTCKTLTTLKLCGGFVLRIPTRVCLPALKILHLDSVIYVDDVSIQNLLSGCPVLEDLDIERRNWDGVQVIDITSPTLKRFSLQFFLYDHFGRFPYKISVSAPSLLYLKLADNMAVKYSVDKMPSLVEAQIGIYNYNSPSSLKLVKEVAHVRVLQLSGKILEFIESAKNYKFPLFHNLVRLELGANKEAGWDLLAELLQSTPNLEVLVFPRGLVKRISSSKKPYFQFEWDPPETVPGCLLLSLKMIIIHDFFGKNCEMDLVEYLLENAKVLKQMTIYFLNFKRQESCQRNLLRCRRGSPTCKLELILKEEHVKIGDTYDRYILPNLRGACENRGYI
ncbi:F-box/LRR-repeat protein At4g14103-like isoform X2 [Daucus carota subsp. sativus]|uniref:F-box/LRR-repeat protein At4g14103-like isoform X2 n=1 Tax=Daucus carota subsp. sativus TaxID=79200 RepID=UPI0007EF7E4B|nr:PREDICTED: F-box/LRR-repeat protein At4g14103-like [Daucus carota subsp. sativus]XP_017220873.1 PREDICTED: F-box/LRR-repeat protein At4g14103-like [Daucus carota subsp. sativus]